MTTRIRRPPPPGAGATVAALTTYLATIVPFARREIARWRRRALRIPDEELRRLALLTIDEEHLNAEAAAVFALLAPRRRRAAVARLCAGWQVMFDYLDTVTEQPSAEPLASGLRLHQALVDAILPSTAAPASTAGYYALYPRHEDGGYLAELAATSRARLHELPAASTVTAAAAAEARRCAHAQSHTHAAVLTGDSAALQRWATSAALDDRVRWHETAAAGISSLAVLALLATAADQATTATSAALIAGAYSPWICALSTLLDSVVDERADALSGNFSYIGPYRDATEAVERMVVVTRQCVEHARQLPRPATHEVITAGLAGFYLSGTTATQRPTVVAISAHLRPAITPTLTFMRLRRALRRDAEDMPKPPRLRGGFD